MATKEAQKVVPLPSRGGDSEWFARKCGLPGCQTESYESQQSLEDHLVKVHELTDEQACLLWWCFDWLIIGTARLRDASGDLEFVLSDGVIRAHHYSCNCNKSSNTKPESVASSLVNSDSLQETMN